MSAQQSHSHSNVSRRRFLKASSIALAGAATLQAPFVHSALGAQDVEVKIGLIGCGGRGTGAALDALGAATHVIYPASGYHTEDVAEGATIEKKNIRVVALADLFEDRLERCRQQLEKLGVHPPREACFVGFDAYRKLLAAPEVNYVILAAPPHFRPEHLRASIEAGKHVFMEKPVAVDVPGVRTVLEASELASRKGLGISAGTQRRHMQSYRETIQRLRDGAIGEILTLKCYWNGGEIWVIRREPQMSDMEWQLRNWNYFTWLSGDHIVEQHVHNLDIMNWVMDAHPLSAVSAVGGRQVRTAEQYGNIFDHFAVEYEYPGGVTMVSQARQINGCKNLVGEVAVGTAGTSNCANWIQPKQGESWRYRQRDRNPYQLEHEHLIESIREGKPINEGRAIAESTMTGIIGREAAYSGQAIEWDAAMKSATRLGPPEYQMGPYPVPPVAMPGTYRFL